MEVLDYHVGFIVIRLKDDVSVTFEEGSQQCYKHSPKLVAQFCEVWNSSQSEQFEIAIRVSVDGSYH